MGNLSKTQTKLQNHRTKMDKLNARNREQQNRQAEAAARIALLRQRPDWELMRLTQDLPYEDEDGTERVLAAGSLTLRINTLPLLKALFWPPPNMYNEVEGLTFFEKSPGKFDPEMGFAEIDRYLEPATDAEAALPRKCLVCGNAAENRGIFCAEEPVFFCDSHYRKDYPLLMPGEGFRESTRADRA